MIFQLTEEERSLFLASYIKFTKKKEAEGNGIREERRKKRRVGLEDVKERSEEGGRGEND